MRELEVGDRVWIRDDLVNNEEYGIELWVEDMVKNEVRTIETVIYSNGSVFVFTIKGDKERYSYSKEMIDWDKTNSITTYIDPNIIKCKEIFDQLLEVGFTRDEALKIMLNTGNVGKNT